MNRGQLTSLTHCKKCGLPIEIHPHWKEVKCNNCGIWNNLKYDYGYDKNLMYYDNTELINKLKTIGVKSTLIKRLNINKIKTLEDVKRVLEFLDIKVNVEKGLIRKGFDKVEDLFD